MTQDEKLLNWLKQAVLDNLENEQFSVEHLSQIVGVSRSHLHRKLKKLKGQSISQFIREIRLEEALKLLHQDVATTSEIAYKVGFNSPSYFHKCFLEYYGYPPGEAKQIFQNREENQESVNVNTTVGQTVESKTLYKIIAAAVLLFFVGYSVFSFINKEKTSPPVEKSIAVLPFKNLSTSEENQHFADGLVDDLLSRLTVIKELKVTSKTSSDTYREIGKKKAKEIASELGVAFLIEGSLQRDSNKVRIYVQLIDAKNDKHIWAKPFDSDVSDVFKTQSEIASLVASELRIVLTDQQQKDIHQNHTDNVKAFELYQLGRFHWSKRTREGLKTSINYFEQAIAEDPEYDLAYANMADSYFLLRNRRNDENKYTEKAEALALNILATGSHLAEAYNVLGGIYTFVDLDWGAAEKIFLQGLEHNPNHSNLHHRYSELLGYTGRPEKARQHINKAIELDPLSFVIRTISVHHYKNQGLLNEALEEIRICNQLIPDKYHPRIAGLTFRLYCQLGDELAALEYFKGWDAVKVDGKPTPEVLDSIYTVSGFKGMLTKKTEMSRFPFEKAMNYALLEEYDSAMYWLEKSYEVNPRVTSMSYSMYEFRALHSNPRFIKLMNEMNLPWAPSEFSD